VVCELSLSGDERQYFSTAWKIVIVGGSKTSPRNISSFWTLSEIEFKDEVEDDESSLFCEEAGMSFSFSFFY